MSDLPTEQQIAKLIESFSDPIEINGVGKKLTPKQLAFVRAFILNGGNGTRAAKEAGYKGSEKSLSVQSADNLVNPRIKWCLAEHQKLLTKAFVWTAEKKREMLAEIALRCMQHEAVVDNEGMPSGEYKFDAGNAIRAIAEDNKMVGDLATIKTDNLQRVSHEEWLNQLK